MEKTWQMTSIQICTTMVTACLQISSVLGVAVKLAKLILFVRR